jgi:glycosyltransferase involved in cell wall biosynthesis
VAAPIFMHPLEDRPMRPALVLWGGYVGGAESLTADLARAIQAQGAEPAVVFVLEEGILADRLDRSDVPYSALGLPRGRAVLRARRRLAQNVSARGPDVAILVDTGYLAAALRSGGYRAPIVGIEHGSLLQAHRLGAWRRVLRSAGRLSGTKACSAVVAVSEYMSERMTTSRLHKRVVCIPNGVDLERFSPSANGAASRPDNIDLEIGCAARLVEGKGVEDVLQALAHPSLQRARLRIAGDGSRLSALQLLAQSLGVYARTDFLGTVLDMPAFWRSADVAVVPSNEWVESFGMAAVEAMACAKAVVATNSGALPEVVADQETGRVVSAGDVDALAFALGEYAQDPARRARHGSNGRRRCEEHYAIEQTAARYLELCAELIRARGQRRWG